MAFCGIFCAANYCLTLKWVVVKKKWLGNTGLEHNAHAVSLGVTTPFY